MKDDEQDPPEPDPDEQDPPEPDPEADPPADPPADDIEKEVEGIVNERVKAALGKIKGKAKEGESKVVTTPDPPAATTGAPDGGVIEDTVRKVLDAKEHDAEHERLKTQGETKPRSERRGIARMMFGKG